MPLLHGATNPAPNNTSTEVKPISGTVTSAADGQPLIGVTVAVKGTSSGTITDIDGNYSLNVDEGATVVFSYTGFKAQELTVGSANTYNIVLQADIALLDEIVVVGYGTQKKSHITGSVSKVENENLDQIAVARVDDALIGQVSGVNIQATSAEAGAAPTITVRGFGSINADSGPASGGRWLGGGFRFSRKLGYE